MNLVVVGVLALQGAFHEHILLLKQAARTSSSSSSSTSTKSTETNFSSAQESALPEFSFIEVRTSEELKTCDALIIPGGESTAISLVAARSGMLEPLREFVKVQRKPTWGTCAGLILLAESANRTKKGGQDLIGGLDVRVNRNHFGRQVESFQAELHLPFLEDLDDGSGGVQGSNNPFPGVFIRAPVVERLLPAVEGVQVEEEQRSDTVVAPSKSMVNDEVKEAVAKGVEVLAVLPGRADRLDGQAEQHKDQAGDIVAVRQGNVFGTSFHPELTTDMRIHMWWLRQLISLRMQKG